MLPGPPRAPHHATMLPSPGRQQARAERVPQPQLPAWALLPAAPAAPIFKGIRDWQRAGERRRIEAAVLLSSHRFQVVLEQPTALLCRCRGPKIQATGAGVEAAPAPASCPCPAHCLCHVPCTMCHVPCPMCYTMCCGLRATHCMPHAVPCAVCCMLYTVPCAVRHVPHTMCHMLCTVPCAVYHMPCTMFHVLCGVCCMPCTVPCAVLCHVPCTARRALCHAAAMCSALSAARYLLHQTPGAVCCVPAAYCHVLCDTVPCVLHPPCVAVPVLADAPGAVTSTGAGCHPKPPQGLKLGLGAAVTGQGPPKTLPGGCHRAGLLDQGCRHHPGCQRRGASLSRSRQPLTRPLGWPR